MAPQTGTALSGSNDSLGASSASGEHNCYATLEELKARLSVTATTDDQMLLDMLRAASREVEGVAGRRFWTITESRYFDARTTGPILIDDVLSLTTLAADEELDGTFDGETWVDGTDYVLQPENDYPKTAIYMLRDRDYDPAPRRRYLKLTGTWGAGNMQDASPWASSGVTGTVADATSTSLTLSAAGAIARGHTILVESEQMFVSALSGSTATVARGVNGTTAAAHSAAAVSIAQYPSDVVRATLYIALLGWRDFSRAGYESERIGDYSYKVSNGGSEAEKIARMLGRVMKWAV